MHVAGHVASSSDQGQIRRVLMVEGLANATILIAKAAVGFTTGSAALMGDAVHSLTDLANNGIALAVEKISREPPDADHPYGHRKFESLAVFGLATLLTVMAIEIAIRAFGRFGHEVSTSGPGLLVMLAVLGVNIALASWEAYWAKRIDSDLLRADARHTFGDVMTTIAVIVGWQLSARGFPWLDGVFAIAIAGLVFYFAFGLFRLVIPKLVDGAVLDSFALIETVGQVDGVLEVRRVRSRSMGDAAAADVVIGVDAGLTTEESHVIADAVEGRLRESFGIEDVSVHIEPVSGPRSRRVI